MPDSRRMSRINQLLKEEIATVILRELDDPTIGFVTIMDVRTSPDLAESRIAISSIRSREESEEAVAALNRASALIARTVRPKIRLKKFPRLVFHFDETTAAATRLNELLASKPSGVGSNPESNSDSDSVASPQEKED